MAFHTLYHKFRNALQESWQTGECASHFGPTSTLEEMFTYLCLHENAQMFLHPPSMDDLRISQKLASESDRFRNEGNKFYKERLLEQALITYNYSILAAPHPPVQSVHEGGSLSFETGVYESLSLGYANRSAVLVELGQYALALNDVDRALALGYPKEKRHKLQERRAKCLISLGKQNEAVDGLESAIEDLKKLSLESKENEEFVTASEKLTKMKSTTKFSSTPISPYNRRIFYTGPSEPPILHDPNPDVPVLNSAVKIAYTPVRGRHLVATRDIQPGEVLGVEEALVAVVRHDNTLSSHCNHCLRRAPCPVPCPRCSLVVFCSGKCRDRSVLGEHGGECPVLDSLLLLKLDNSAALAFRIIAKMRLDKLKQHVAAFAHNGHKPLLQVCRDYRALYYLESHITARPEEELQEATAAAVILTKLLFESCPNFLKDDNHKSITLTVQDYPLVGAQFIRLILGIECNSHCLKEVAVVAEDRSGSPAARGQDIGYGVFSALSLINHSCAPNALTSALGRTKFLYSVAFIPKGYEVTDTYGERFVSHTRAQRRESLQKTYFFCCGCIACLADWPMFLHLPNQVQLRCPLCARPLSGTACSFCEVDCTSSTKTKSGIQLYNAIEVQNQLSHKWKIYEQAASEIRNGYVTANNIGDVITVLQLLESYAHQPNQHYILVQETLMAAFDIQGSVIYR
ncbi:unnamed protein product [Meganyctiphanes norvegica]|uniref:SET domain-containing protein n=1 Tax=Meganyctiphanes norvegica TaxID=48144 RepID=A0AAV2Q5X5_MEGNR